MRAMSEPTTRPPRVVGVLLEATPVDEVDEGPAEIRFRLPIKEEGGDDHPVHSPCPPTVEGPFLFPDRYARIDARPAPTPVASTTSAGRFECDGESWRERAGEFVKAR